MSGIYYPQIGRVAAQFPIVRRFARPVYANKLCDGTLIRMATPAPEQISWTLQYTGLSAAEWDELQSFFAVVEGRYGEFTYLDAADNLLAWSEDFTQSVWAAGALVQVAGGATDPSGGTGAWQITNASQATAAITQSITAPSRQQYCFSIYVRSDTTATISLVVACTGESIQQSVAAGPEWRRVAISGALEAREDGVKFGLQIPPGASVCAFGAQVEAQPGAGAYKKTTARGGVYEKCRLDQDALTQVTEGVGQHSTVVRIVTLG